MPNESAPTSALSCSLIVPVFRGGKHFAACLASLRAALRPNDELIVVANGEGDGTWRLADEAGIRLLNLPSNRGPAHARNAGAQIAQGELLFFVDADVTVPPHCLRGLAGHFERDPDLAALIGSYDEAPGERNFCSQFKNLFHHYVHQRGSAEASTFWGACGAIRRQTFLELGGFDENYGRSCIEDIELGYRLRASGQRILLAHEIQVTHWKRWSFWKLLRSDTFDRAAPWMELILDQLVQNRRGVATDLNLGFRYQLSLVISFLLFGAGVGAFFWSQIIWVALGLAIFFVALHGSLFRFFCARRGWMFCLLAIPWRFFYDLCSGLGSSYGAATFACRAIAQRRRLSPKEKTLREIAGRIGYLPNSEQTRESDRLPQIPAGECPSEA